MKSLLKSITAPFRRKSVQYGTLEDYQFWTQLSTNHPYPGPSNFFGVMAALRAGTAIAQGVGQVDLHVKHERVQGDHVIRRNAVEDRTYRLLNRRPNDWMTSVELREALTMHAVFAGAGRAFVRRGSDGRPLEILPLHPRWVNAYHDQTAREFVYEIGVAEYGIYGKFGRDDIIEITNPRWDFVHGLDVTRSAAAALGLSKDLEGRQAKLAAGNAPYGIISADQGQAPERMALLKKAWADQFGEGNGIGIIDFAAQFQQMAGSPQDQQSIENRKFQIEEIARAYGVFPQMLMHSDKTSTFASAESFFNAHLVHTMQPWFTRWEQALDRTLFDQSRHLRAEFNERALIRMSPSDRAEYLSRALGAGGSAPWMTQNEARQEQGLNPVEGGDVLPMITKEQSNADVEPEV